MTVKELIVEINTARNQKTSANTRDEVRVMMTMLNDPTFKVDVYNRTGVTGQFCPYEASRQMIVNIIKDATKISTQEARALAESYQFDRSTSDTMVGISKEFINTYLETGRKLPLGGREKSNISIAKKVKPAKVNTYPKKVGIADDGSDIYETVNDGMTPEHGSIKVYSPCPTWLSNK